MRKNLTAVLMIGLAMSTAIFAFLWSAERNSRDDVRELAQSAAVHACTQFASYQNSGDIGRYWEGVSAFWAFAQAYRAAFQDTNGATNALICNAVYGYLVDGPEINQPHIPDLVRILEALSKDIEDLSGHAQMLSLRNQYLHGT